MPIPSETTNKPGFFHCSIFMENAEVSKLQVVLSCLRSDDQTNVLIERKIPLGLNR